MNILDLRRERGVYRARHEREADDRRGVLELARADQLVEPGQEEASGARDDHDCGAQLVAGGCRDEHEHRARDGEQKGAERGARGVGRAREQDETRSEPRSREHA